MVLTGWNIDSDIVCDYFIAHIDCFKYDFEAVFFIYKKTKKPQ